MLVVHVHVHVKLESVDGFKKATLANATESLKEPGVARFDVVQEMGGDGTRFILVEAYRSADDANRHKETLHYLHWRDSVAEMMAEPRRSIKYASVFPDDKGW